MVFYQIHQIIIENDWSTLRRDLANEAPHIKHLWCSVYFNGDLPLAMAMKRLCPERIVLDLLKIYPRAASIPDQNGSLPHQLCTKLGYSSVTFNALVLERSMETNRQEENSTKYRHQRSQSSVDSKSCDTCDNTSEDTPSCASVESQLSKKLTLENTISRLSEQLHVAQVSERALEIKLIDIEQKISDLELKFTHLISDLRSDVEESLQREHFHILDMRDDISYVASKVGVIRTKSLKYMKEMKGVEDKITSKQGKIANDMFRNSPIGLRRKTLSKTNNFIRKERRASLNSKARFPFDQTYKPRKSIKKGVSIAAGSMLDFAIDCFVR